MADLSQAIRDWQTFYFLVGGAAAGLVGLTFVSITVGSGTITKQNISGLRTFINPSLIDFIYVLVTASVIVMPTVTRMQLGILLVFAGLVSSGRTLSTLPFVLQHYKRHIVDVHDWAWYFLAPLARYPDICGSRRGASPGGQSGSQRISVGQRLASHRGDPEHLGHDLVVHD